MPDLSVEEKDQADRIMSWIKAKLPTGTPTPGLQDTVETWSATAWLILLLRWQQHMPAAPQRL